MQKEKEPIIIPGYLREEFVMIKNFLLHNTGLMACTEKEKELFEILRGIK